MRACIGRPFAWQEALLAVAVLLQNFDFRLHDPSYELAIKSTLTIKPKDFYMHASLRYPDGPIYRPEGSHLGHSHRLSPEGTAVSALTRCSPLKDYLL